MLQGAFSTPRCLPLEPFSGVLLGHSRGVLGGLWGRHEAKLGRLLASRPLPSLALPLLALLLASALAASASCSLGLPPLAVSPWPPPYAARRLRPTATDRPAAAQRADEAKTLLGSFWGPPGPSWAPLTPSWGPLGSSWGPLGCLLGRLGAISGAPWAVLGVLRPGKASVRKSFKNLEIITIVCFWRLSRESS